MRVKYTDGGDKALIVGEQLKSTRRAVKEAMEAKDKAIRTARSN